MVLFLWSIERGAGGEEKPEEEKKKGGGGFFAKKTFSPPLFRFARGCGGGLKWGRKEAPFLPHLPLLFIQTF